MPIIKNIYHGAQRLHQILGKFRPPELWHGLPIGAPFFAPPKIVLDMGGGVGGSFMVLWGMLSETLTLFKIIWTRYSPLL